MSSGPAAFIGIDAASRQAHVTSPRQTDPEDASPSASERADARVRLSCDQRPEQTFRSWSSSSPPSAAMFARYSPARPSSSQADCSASTDPTSFEPTPRFRQRPHTPGTATAGAACAARARSRAHPGTTASAVRDRRPARCACPPAAANPRLTTAVTNSPRSCHIPRSCVTSPLAVRNSGTCTRRNPRGLKPGLTFGSCNTVIPSDTSRPQSYRPIRRRAHRISAQHPPSDAPPADTIPRAREPCRSTSV